MKAINSELVTKPIKIGYGVSVSDEAQIKKAMQTASAYWGGFQHCMIPLFSESDNVRSWQRKYSRRIPSLRITEEYVESFSPDYLSYPDRRSPRYEHSIEEIKFNKLLSGSPYPNIEYGISFVEALNSEIERLYDTGGDSSKIPLIVSDGSSPVLDAFLLRTRSGIHNALKRDCDKTGLYDVKEVNAQNYLGVYCEDDPMSFIAISRLKLNVEGATHEKMTLLLCDSTNWMDAFHLWNMRAGGYRVFPLFLDQIKTDEDVTMIRHFISRNSPKNEVSWSKLPELYISDRLKIKDVDEFLEKLKNETESNKHGIVSGSWNFPRYWYTKECRERRKQISDYYCRREDKEIFTGGDYLTIPLACPVHSRSSGSEPIYKMECAFMTYSDSEHAVVFPETSIQGYPEISFRNNKAVIFAHSYEKMVLLPLLMADSFVSDFLKNAQVECVVSQPGKFLTKMIKSAQGVHRASPLMIKGMLEFLYTIEKTHSKSVNGGIKKLLNKSSSWGWNDAKKVLKKLVSQKALKMLIQLNCPNCNQKFEVSFGDLEEEMLCVTCFEKFDDHSSDPNNMTFVYSRAGVLSLPRKSYGVPVVYLTLAFFEKDGLSSAVNRGTSYNIKINGAEREVDLITFVASGAWFDKRVRPVFAECKFNCEFQKSDVELFENIGAKFVGALLVFSTMKEFLSQREKILLRKLARKLRSNFKKVGKGSNLLVLTANELERMGSNWDVWGAGYQDFLNTERELLGYFDADCFVSQEKYLDLDMCEMRAVSEPISVSFVI